MITPKSKDSGLNQHNQQNSYWIICPGLNKKGVFQCCVHQQICADSALSEVESTSICINIYFPHFKFKAAENTKGCYFAQLTELKWSGTVAAGIKSFLSKENETCSQAGLQLLEQIEPFLFCGKYKSRHFIRLMQAIISPFISSPKYGD